MKRILLIGTGGSIASEKSSEGLKPALSSAQLLEFIPSVFQFCEVDCCQPFSLDSTNVCPQNWLEIVAVIQKNYEEYDGFVISHGTDTMAYTAAALSYLIQGSKKPIILTGAQKPIGFESTDSKSNLMDAFRCAVSDTLHGVMIVFSGKVIPGPRACKTRTKSFEAFSSINYPYLAIVQDNRLVQFLENSYQPEPTFYHAVCPDVAMLKLIPGVKPDLVSYMLAQNDALILESFGVGGVPTYPDSDFLPALEAGCRAGKIIVLSTQVQEEGSNLNIYQVARKIRRYRQVLDAHDMTTEALVGKLMWILALTHDPEEVRRLFYTPVANDIWDYPPDLL